MSTPRTLTTSALVQALRVAQGPGFQAGGSTDRILQLAAGAARPGC